MTIRLLQNRLIYEKMQELESCDLIYSSTQQILADWDFSCTNISLHSNCDGLELCVHALCLFVLILHIIRGGNYADCSQSAGVMSCWVEAGCQNWPEKPGKPTGMMQIGKKNTLRQQNNRGAELTKTFNTVTEVMEASRGSCGDRGGKVIR